MFKYIFLCCILVALDKVQCSTKEVIDAHFMEVIKKCREESSITEDQLERGRKGDFPNEESFKCYLRCLYDSVGTIKPDGSIDVDKLVSIIPESIRHLHAEPIKKCGTIHGVDLCDTASKTAYCVFENNEEHFYIP